LIVPFSGFPDKSVRSGEAIDEQAGRSEEPCAEWLLGENGGTQELAGRGQPFTDRAAVLSQIFGLRRARPVQSGEALDEAVEELQLVGGTLLDCGKSGSGREKARDLKRRESPPQRFFSSSDDLHLKQSVA
jgi:hypothetical protein